MNLPLSFVFCRNLQRYLWVFGIVAFSCLNGFGQLTHPLFRSFSFGEENQFPQQLSIASDFLGGIWMAGEEGLLYYDGHKFHTIPLPFRAVYVTTDPKGRVFVGCNSDFGTLTISPQKKLEYVSLGESFTGKQEINGEISKIMVIGDTVYAYTKATLYAISTDKTAKSHWSFGTETSGSILFNKSILINHPQKGLCRITGKELKPISNASLLAQKEITSSLSINNYWELIATNTGNLYLANNQTVKQISELWKQSDEVSRYLQKFGIADMALLGSSKIVIGTLTGGVIYVNRFSGELLQTLNQQNGFLNNNVFAVTADPENGTWVALENGLVRVMESSFLSDARQLYGLQKNIPEILDIIRHKKRLYIATREGLFVLAQQITVVNLPVVNFSSEKESAKPTKKKLFGKRKNLKKKPPENSANDYLQIKVKTNVWEFEQINGIKGSCNKLISLPEELIVAGDGGLYTVSGKTAVPIVPSMQGKYVGSAFPIRWPDGLQIVAATGTGLEIISHHNNTWKYLGKVQGLTEKVTTIAEEGNGKLWVTLEDKGIYSIKFKGLDDLSPATRYYGKQHKLPAQPLKVASSGHEMIFYTDTRTYQRNEKEDSFAPNDFLNQYLNKQTTIRGGSNQDFWILSDQQLFRISRKNTRKVVDTLTDLISPIYFQTHNINEVFPDTADNAWIVTAKGLFLLRAKKQAAASKFQVWLTEMRSTKDTLLFTGFIADKDNIARIAKPNLDLGSIPYDFNSITFSLTSSAHDNSLNTWYQHLLEGLEDDWSNWTHDATAHYSKLPPGSYTLRVRARNLTGEISQVAAYQFLVESPFYLRWYAYLFYALLGIGAVWGIIYLNNKRLQAENRRLDTIVKERTTEVEGQKVQLLLTNSQLETQKSQLQDALNQVQAAQEQLIQSEKMAALGVMIASVAHEINSPFGAIKNTVYTLSEQLPALHKLLKILVETTDTALTQQVFQLVEQINETQITISTREERKIRNAFTQELQAAQIKQPENIATRLVEMGLRENPSKYQLILQHPNSESFLAVAELLAKLSNSIKRIRVATDKTQKIVSSLKSYTHQSTVVEAATPFDLAENIDTVLTIYQAELRQGIDVTRNLAAGITIMGFPDELTQVWTNLITNAIHGMGGNGSLEITETHTATHVTVQITDSGSGIEPAILGKIFQPFFTTKPKGQGSGLGLHITKEIIQKHHGKIWVESTSGKTTFFVELPIYQEKS